MELMLPSEVVRNAVSQHGAPLYLYSRDALSRSAASALRFKTPFGTTVRYAMKANPHPTFLKDLHGMGLKIDASSGGEVERALAAGIPADAITLNSQELPENLQELLDKGVFLVATSLHQLQTVGSMAPRTSVGVRINPGIGSGANNRLTTGGVNAGFGIWYEYLPEALRIAKKHDLTITTLHTHIGSGTDPSAWQQTARVTLELLNDVPSATTVSFGGGFKTARTDDEHTADMATISEHISELITQFADDTGRQMHVEIEPGTFLAANAGWLAARVIDITDTGTDGRTFLRVSTGMNDILRFSLYGAQHTLQVIPTDGRTDASTTEYVVIGHCCESGDILTPERGDPESIAPRRLQTAKIGDLLLINGCGAYCASMRAIDYNSFKPAGEVIL